MCAGVAACAAACAETLPAPQNPATTQPTAVQCVTRTPVEDTFWEAQRESERSRPPRSRPKSISLGFGPDEPLAGGMTRNTITAPSAPADPYQHQYWNGYVSSPRWRVARPPWDRPNHPHALPYGPPPPIYPGALGASYGGCAPCARQPAFSEH
jgi:hypothetical protein